MREMIDPIRHEHVSVLSWHQQREEFRENAHRELRLRENLPQAENGRYLMPDGKSYGLAIGAVKGSGADKPIAEGIEEAIIGAEARFTVKDEGTKEFDQEFRDLLRDALNYVQSEEVRHVASNPNDPILQSHCPEMPDGVYEDEAKLGKWIEDHVSQGDSE